MLNWILTLVEALAEWLGGPWGYDERPALQEAVLYVEERPRR